MLKELKRPGLLLLLLSLLGCSGLLLHYYDPTTYKNLTDLKPKVAALYESGLFTIYICSQIMYTYI